jgi:MFS family permease
MCRYSLSAFQSGLVVSMSLAGALLGSGVALLYGDKLGRRKELLLAAGLYGELVEVFGLL